MQKLAIFLFVVALGMACESTEQNLSPNLVPASVASTFATLYPDTPVEWEAEDNGTFEAEFTVEGQEIEAIFTATGEWLQTEVEITTSALPPAVAAAIATHFPGSAITEADRITYPDGRTAYETELDGDNNSSLEVLFTADGSLVERQTEMEAED